MFNDIIFTAFNKLSEQSEFLVHAEWQGDGGRSCKPSKGIGSRGVSYSEYKLNIWNLQNHGLSILTVLTIRIFILK